MKGLFPEFDPGAEKNFKAIWKEALFVFDTNVLLNLYRYQESTREQLLDVIEKLADRIWIPHHVALEFQRNRLIAIADQSKRFTDVRTTIDKAKNTLVGGFEQLQLTKRHSLIDPEPLTSGFNKLVEEFLENLKKIETKQQKLGEIDPIKIRIEDLFDTRVGAAPKDQNEIDELYKDGDRRFKLKIPPGYLDADKDKKEPDEYLHGVIVYKRKYGDFLVWNQLLAHAEKSGISSVVFVTDDVKDDWWWRLQSGGQKTLGPRPELVAEARSRGGISSFLMYKPEDFLKYANDNLQLDISNEVIQEVRDVAEANVHIGNVFSAYREEKVQTELSVYDWLTTQFSDVVKSSSEFPEYIATSNDKIIAVGVSMETAFHAVSSYIDKIVNYIKSAKVFDVDEVRIILVIKDSSSSKKIVDVLDRIMQEVIEARGFSFIIGRLEYQSLSHRIFKPLKKIHTHQHGISVVDLD